MATARPISTYQPSRHSVDPAAPLRAARCLQAPRALMKQSIYGRAAGCRGTLVARASGGLDPHQEPVSSWEVEEGIRDETVELVVSGLSVSDFGFVCLLGPEMCSVAEPPTSLEAAFQENCHMMPVQITSGGCDRTEAESPEALTMLQLVQGIDVGVRLPYEALMQACPGIPDGSMLHEVVLEEVPALGDDKSPSFSASLRVDTQTFKCPSPFEAIALALRYKAPIVAPAEVLQDKMLTSPEARQRFPNALPAEESAKQAQSITSNICVAWRAAATPIGDDDIMQLRQQLRSSDD